MNLPKIQALIAPLSAPIPSALGVALQAFLYFQVQSLFLAWVAAIGAFVGIEAIGGASCYAVVKLHRQKSYGIEFFVSLLGIIVYIFSGYLVLHTTVILIFFFLAPFSYFAYAILRNMEAEHIEKVSETEAQIRLIEAQTKQINAETRKTKASNVVIPTYPTNPTTYKRSWICPHCGEDQQKPQRYSVHMRYCKANTEQPKD